MSAALREQAEYEAACESAIGAAAALLAAAESMFFPDTGVWRENVIKAASRYRARLDERAEAQARFVAAERARR